MYIKRKTPDPSRNLDNKPDIPVTLFVTLFGTLVSNLVKVR